MSTPSLALDGPLAASSAVSHPFLERLRRADRGSLVVRTFAAEYSVLRRGARVLDAALPEAHDAYRDFLNGLGLVGPGWMDQALDGTRAALEAVQTLGRDALRHDGALWAIERVGRRWAALCAERPWGGAFWQARAACKMLIPDPVSDHGGLDQNWVAGREAACTALSSWLDALERAVTDERVA